MEMIGHDDEFTGIYLGKPGGEAKPSALDGVTRVVELQFIALDSAEEREVFLANCGHAGCTRAAMVIAR